MTSKRRSGSTPTGETTQRVKQGGNPMPFLRSHHIEWLSRHHGKPILGITGNHLKDAQLARNSSFLTFATAGRLHQSWDHAGPRPGHPQACSTSPLDRKRALLKHGLSSPLFQAVLPTVVSASWSTIRNVIRC